MPNTKAKVAYTARSIQSLDNGQLLELFEIVASDIRRRIKNYGAADEPLALLDGITFAARASRIKTDLALGGGGLDGYRYGLLHGKGTLLDRLAGLSLDSLDDDVLDGIDLDA